VLSAVDPRSRSSWDRCGRASPRFLCASTQRVHTDAIVRVRCIAAFAAVLIVSACSSGASRQEYVTSVDGLIATMDDELIEAGNLYCAEVRLEGDQGDCYDAESTIENVRSLEEKQAAARQAFVEGFGALEPPRGMQEFHDTALGIMTDLAAAEAALAEVAEVGSFVSLNALFQSPEGQRVADAEREAVALCEAAQADIETAEDARLAGTVWIPPELKEVVTVAFRCTG
jgi:hypothetical protein